MDACSIILLAKATMIETLSNFHKISISEGVYIEVLEGKKEKTSDALLAERLVKENKITVIKPNKTQLLKKLIEDFGLGYGEAETISTYFDKNMDAVITDNKQGRKIAKIYNIPLIGSPEIVVALYKLKKIDKDKALSAIKSLSEFGWFENYILETAKENIEGGE